MCGGIYDVTPSDFWNKGLFFWGIQEHIQIHFLESYRLFLFTLNSINLWASLEIFGNLWESVRIFGNLWDS